MQNTDYIKKIEGNLYHFYQLAAGEASLRYHEEEHFSWVRNPEGAWPNYVFNIDMECLTRKDFIDQLAARIKRKELPSVIVNRLPEEADTYYGLASRNGLREIFGWTGMALDRQGYSSRADHTTGLRVEKVSGEGQLKTWTDLVNAALFNSKSLSLKITTALSRIAGMQLYTGFESNVPVCTALSFYRDGVAGLYMIATLPEYRGKGYGTQVTVSAMERCFASGAETIILHASRMGETLYRRLGFTDYCKFGILWMVGKEFR